MQPTQGPFVPPPPLADSGSSAAPKWYHQKWFVILMLLLFFPIGLVLLWTSPITKTSGRIVWTVVVALSFVIYLGGRNSSPAPSSAKPPAPAASKQTTDNTAAKPAQPPKDEFPFKMTNNAGKVYKGKKVSDVGVLVFDVSTSKTVGSNQFTQKSASSGAMFVQVKIVVANDQKDAITMDGNLFKLLAGGREYSYSSEAMTSLMMEDKESFFLKQINPGLIAQGTIVFEVPESLKLDAATLQFRGGFTGKTDVLPLKPITE